VCGVERGAGGHLAPARRPLDALLADLARPPPALAAGARVGRFEILRPRGQGGMGTVYEARDSALRRLVALKVIRVERESAATVELCKNGPSRSRVASKKSHHCSFVHADEGNSRSRRLRARRVRTAK
jgi:serine/threonine protein kinase